MDILNLITKILLLLLLIVQLIVMVYVFFINHKRFQEDQKFWAKLDEQIDEARQKYQLYLEERPLEDVGNEQEIKK